MLNSIFSEIFSKHKYKIEFIEMDIMKYEQCIKNVVNSLLVSL